MKVGRAENSTPRKAQGAGSEIKRAEEVREARGHTESGNHQWRGREKRG